MWNTLRYRCINVIMVMAVVLGNAIITKRVEIGILSALALVIVRKDKSLFRYMPISSKDSFIIQLLATVITLVAVKYIGVAHPNSLLIILLFQIASYNTVKQERPSYNVIELGLIIASFVGMFVVGALIPEYLEWVGWIGFIIIYRTIQ